MRAKPLIALIAACFAFSLQALAAEWPSFKDFYDNMDVRKQTRLHARVYLSDNRAVRVEWTGTVVEVQGKPGRVRVDLYNKERPGVEGVNLVLFVRGDTSGATELKKGETARFGGYVEDVIYGEEGLALVLRPAEILYETP